MAQLYLPPSLFREACADMLKSRPPFSDFGELGISLLPTLKVFELILQPIASDLMPHSTMGDIVKALLAETKEHTKALDLLSTSAAFLHIRKIEELCATSLYLMKDSQRWERLSWQWKHYGMLDVIRRRGPGDSQYAESEKWYKEQSEKIKEYWKLSGDLLTDLKKITYIRAWNSPDSIKDVFREAGELDSYERSFYNFGSSFTHFSPVTTVIENADTEYGEPLEVGNFITKGRLVQMARALMRMTVDVVSHERRAKTLDLILIYEQLSADSKHRLLAEKSPVYSVLAGYLHKKITSEQVFNRLPGSKFPPAYQIGEPPGPKT